MQLWGLAQLPLPRRDDLRCRSLGSRPGRMQLAAAERVPQRRTELGQRVRTAHRRCQPELPLRSKQRARLRLPHLHSLRLLPSRRSTRLELQELADSNRLPRARTERWQCMRGRRPRVQLRPLVHRRCRRALYRKRLGVGRAGVPGMTRADGRSMDCAPSWPTACASSSANCRCR